MKKAITLVVLLFATILANAATYRVAVDGSGNYTTIAQVNAASFSAGDSILFKRGDTWRGVQLSLPSGGTSGNHVVYGAYGTGAKPRILGSLLETSWTNTSGNIWRSNSTYTQNPNAWPYGGSSIWFIETNGDVSWGKPYKANTDLFEEEYDWTWASNYIYIYSPTNPNTRYTGVEIPVIRYSLYLNGKSYIIIDGFELAYAGDRIVEEKWYQHENIVTDMIIRNCHIHHTGVREGTGYGMEVWHSNMLIQNNEIHDCGRRAVSIRMWEYDLTISNIIIEGNTFYNGFHTTSMDIATNDIGKIENVTFRNNYVYERPEPLEDESYSTTFFFIAAQGVDNTLKDIYIYNNILKNINANLMNAGDVYGAKNLQFYNNTIYGVSPYITNTNRTFLYIQDGTEMTIKNNIFYNNVDIAQNSNFKNITIFSDAGTVTLDNNLFYHSSTATRLISWRGTIYDIADSTAYRTATGQDTNSIIAKDPLFVSSSDYRLQSNSPAINAGANLNLTTDYLGNTRVGLPDIGAYEYNVSDPDPGESSKRLKKNTRTGKLINVK